LLRSREATGFSEVCLELERIVEKLRSAGEAEGGEEVRWELVVPFEETTCSGPTNLNDDE
jgi:hypothetical protein